MSLLNVGARARLANQAALQTTGHNIANASVAGYSRQSVAMETMTGRLTSAGYVGNGVNAATILRNHNELLTRQAAAAQAVQSADTSRYERLAQVQDVFQGGTQGLGAAITDMLNSLADVVASPTDMTARTVTLTRMNEMAARMRSSSEQLREIGESVSQQLDNSVDKINTLAKSIAGVNEQIARIGVNGQPPNDLLDKRDQLIRELNQHVQTTQIAADDGTVGVFLASSQPLVLGSGAATVSVGEPAQFPGSGQTALFIHRPGTAPLELQEGMLGGGEVAGLLNFANNDLPEARNLLGRMALAIGTTMNAQQTLGLTLDGQLGKSLFSAQAAADGHTQGMAVGSIDLSDSTKLSPSQFAASDYEVRFTTPPAGQVVRLSDGKATAFTDLNDLRSQQIDGLTFDFSVAGAANERVLFQPFAGTAGNIQSLVYSPRDLAAANPINAAMGTSNAGTLQLASLKATGLPNPPGLVLPPNGDTATPPAFSGGVQLAFTAGPPATYDVLNHGTAPPTTVATGQAYTPGQPITIDGWSVTLQGTPQSGDTVKIGNALDPQYGDIYTRNAGNATALMNLHDEKMFDGAALSDGYAGLMAQVGTRTQSAEYASQVSGTIANNLEADRTSVAGVNLDEEAAKLIQYQQAYQASAKVLQIAQNIFDTLIQSIGR